MGDYNGRIGEIIRAFEKYPAGDLNTRMLVREALAAERAEAFKAGYSEGIHDACEAKRSERERSAVAAEDVDLSGLETLARWYDDWAQVSRDDDGNLILKHVPTDALYRVLPIEES